MNIPSLTRTFVIRNQRGLHARAAAKFVKLAGQFSAQITVTKDGQSVNGDSIMGLMMLAASINTDIHIATQGSDAEAAINAIEKLINNKFGEDG